MIAAVKASSQEIDYPSPRVAWWGVALFVTAVGLAFLGRQIITSLAEDLRQSLGLSDTRIGLLQGLSIALLMTLAALPIGRLVDTANRRNLMIGSILFWSLMTCLCGLAGGFWQLFVYRLGVGLGEAGLHPAIYSSLSDLFPPSRRVYANVTYGIGTMIASSAAISLNGFSIDFIHRWQIGHPGFAGIDSWRLVFLLVGLPGPLLALAFLTLREPRRDNAPQPRNSASFRDFLGFLRVRKGFFFWALLGWAAIEISLADVLGWTPTILVRQFGFTEGTASVRLGAVAGVASVLGVGVATLLVRVGRRRGWSSLMPRIAMGGAFLGIPFAACISFTNSGTALLAVFGLLFFSNFLAVGLLPTLFQEVTPNRFRGRIVALELQAVFVSVSLGMGFVGVFSDFLAVVPRGLAISVSFAATGSMIIAAYALKRAAAGYGRLPHTESGFEFDGQDRG
jgi:MFS family permease